MRNNRITKLVVISIWLVIGLTGCASLISRPGKVVLLPEDRIFSLPAGQKISVMLDKKPMEITFPEEMKIVSPTVLVRQEEKLNNALLDKVKANQDNAKKMGLITAIFSTLGGVAWIIFNIKKWKPNLKLEVK
jgi:hypothetical protein